MAPLRMLLSKLAGLFRKARLEQQLDEDVRAHLKMLTEENLRKGLSPEDARYAAMRQFGNVSSMKEECRDTWSVRIISELFQDVRYGLRQLRRNPGFTAVAVITLALGIGANTAIFSVVNTVLLRPLPYKDPGRLVMATERFGPGVGVVMVMGPDYIAWKDHSRVFKQVGAFGGGPGNNLTGMGEPERVTTVGVSTGLFHTLGVQPILGRAFTADEGLEGQNYVALISENLWRSRAGANPEILGRTIHLDKQPYTVVGVMPTILQYPAADVWTPLALNAPAFSVESPGSLGLTVIGRLKPGATPRQAELDLQLITDRMTSQYQPQVASHRARVRVEVVPLHELLVRNVRSLLLILLGAVAFVLLIACANVSNLLLSRAAARGREMAVRAALGAGRVRLVRQLLTESLILSAVGGLFGFLVGLWTVQLLRPLIPPNFPSEISLDPRVFGFVISIAVLAVLFFGLVPALIASRPDAIEALRAVGVSAESGGDLPRLRNLLVVGQVGLSLILLIGAGLLAQSFVRLSNVTLGFDHHHILTAQVSRPVTSNLKASASLFSEMLTRIRALPGVNGAAVTAHTPVGSSAQAVWGLRTQGGITLSRAQTIFMTAISPDYFRTMGIRLLKGRFFDEHDSESAAGVVIINKTLARMAFEDRDPLGRQIRFGRPDASWQTVVGVVADTRNGKLEQPPWPEIFFPYAQMCPPFITFVLRSSGDPLSLAAAVQKAVQSVDKDQAVSNIQTMDAAITKSVAPQWFRMLLFGLFALLALTLAAIGIFGMVAYSVSHRTHEIGIRMALGAVKGDVLRMVVGQGLRLALIGVAIGISGALALTRFLASLLYGITPTDPLTFIAVSLILIAVALLACYIPARRAAKVDPMVALRYE